MNVLSIRNLSKSFGQQQIIKDLNMSVPEGSVFGFIGQNGAGKTTTMKMVLGLCSPIREKSLCVMSLFTLDRPKQISILDICRMCRNFITI